MTGKNTPTAALPADTAQRPSEQSAAAVEEAEEVTVPAAMEPITDEEILLMLMSMHQ